LDGWRLHETLEYWMRTAVEGPRFWDKYPPGTF
jgi:hypothetical protein